MVVVMAGMAFLGTHFAPQAGGVSSAASCRRFFTSRRLRGNSSLSPRKLSRHRLRRGNPLHLMRLEPRQHLLAEAADLLEEDLVRHGADVYVQQQVIGAHPLGALDQPIADVLGGTPR